MSQDLAERIVGWTYPEPYAIYNHAPQGRATVERQLLDSELGYEAILDDHGDLVAFWCGGADARVRGGDYSVEAVDLGLGLRPDLTGQGRGRALVQAVVDRARAKHGGWLLRVTIAEFNTRALRVWEQEGFSRDSTFRRVSDGQTFVLLMGRATGVRRGRRGW